MSEWFNVLYDQEGRPFGLRLSETCSQVLKAIKSSDDYRENLVTILSFQLLSSELERVQEILNGEVNKIALESQELSSMARSDANKIAALQDRIKELEAELQKVKEESQVK